MILCGNNKEELKSSGFLEFEVGLSMVSIVNKIRNFDCLLRS